MKLIVTKEASEKLLNEFPNHSEGDVPALCYSYTPYIEEKYDRDAEPVSISFVKTNTSPGGSKWRLSWYNREDVPLEVIYSTETIEVAIIGPIPKSSKIIRVYAEDGQFKVLCE